LLQGVDRVFEGGMPRAVTLTVGELPATINSVLFQIFADDFQAPVLNSHFQVSLNGTRIPVSMRPWQGGKLSGHPHE